MLPSTSSCFLLFSWVLQIIELGVFVGNIICNCVACPKNDDKPKRTQMMMMVLVPLVLLMLMLLLMAHCFQYGFSSGSPSSPSLPHPLHTHVSVAKFKQLLPANAFNGKTSFVAPNGAVAKVSFCLVSFRFGFFSFLLCFSPLQIFIEFE